MIRLYLMQHGKSLPKEEDEEEALSKEGIQVVEKSAKAIKTLLSKKFDLIIASPKKRSYQTATIVADVIDYPKENILQTSVIKALAPSEESIAFLSKQKKGSILVVGHLPSLLQISSFLLSREEVKMEFVNGGLTHILVEKWEREKGSLVWHLTSEILEKLNPS